MRHLNSGDGCFFAFIAMFSTRALQRLFQIVCSKNAKDDGLIVFYSDITDTIRNSIADKIKMPRLPLNHTTQADHGVQIAIA